MAGLLGTKDEHAAMALTDAASRLLGNGHDVPPGFVGLLFARTAAEDLIGYTPDELAELAGEAAQFLGTRRRGEPKIRFDSPASASGKHLNAISVIEVINDTCRSLSIP